MFNVFDLLPAFPWEGPPLPRFLHVLWPWLQSPSESFLPSLPETTTYDNIEEIEFPEGFDEDTLMPRKIVIHRRAKVLK